MPANAAACFHTSALHPAQYSWPGKHDKGLCLFPGLRFPGVLRPLFQADQHLRTFFKTSLTIFPCCGIVIKSTTWARSSAGRAFGSHPRGRGFDPLRVHHKKYRRYVCICGIFVVRYTLVDLKRLFWCFTLRENHYRENYCEIIGLNQKGLENQGILV